MGTPVFRVDRNADAPSVVEYEFHGVANNTIAAVAQATGVINASFDYAPFGEVVEATNAGGSSSGLPSHRRRMNDKFVDDVSGLAYYGYRYYDKHSMTWTQSDPLYRFAPDGAWAQPRRALLYVNDLNNPIRFIDPDGRGVVEAGKAVLETLIAPVNGGGATASGGVVSGTVLAEGSTPTTALASTGWVAAGATAVVLIGGLVIANELTDGAVFRPVPFPPQIDASPRKKKDGTPEPPDEKDIPTDKIKKLPPPPAQPGDGQQEPPPARIRPKLPWWRRLFSGTPATSTSTSSDASTRHRPADADGDGKVSDDEESTWMSQAQ